MTNKRDTAHRHGLRAEGFAVWLLRVKGYCVLERRWRCPAGEIDIIAQRGQVTVFCEVKCRGDMDTALSCLSPHGQARITRAATSYLAAHPALMDGVVRFDFIALAPRSFGGGRLRWFFWRHLDNAWLTPT